MSTADLLNALAMLEHPQGVIAFPTDTVYGLGCLPEKPAAIQKLRCLRGLSEQEPLLLLGQSWEYLIPYVQCQSPIMMLKAQELMTAYWPGAVTLILPKSTQVPPEVAGGSATLGVRVADCSLLDDLLRLTTYGVLVTTAAQKHNQPACCSADAVSQAFGQEVDTILAEDTAVKRQVPSALVVIHTDGSLQVLRGTL